MRNLAVINTGLVNRFESFLDVSTLTIKSYKSGVKQFLTFLAQNEIKNPCRENVIQFKKSDGI